MDLFFLNTYWTKLLKNKIFKNYNYVKFKNKIKLKNNKIIKKNYKKEKETGCRGQRAWITSGNLLFKSFSEQNWASLVAQTVKNPPAMQETWVWSLGWKDPLEKGMATHSSILAWRIPWTGEPDGLVGLQSPAWLTVSLFFLNLYWAELHLLKWQWWNGLCSELNNSLHPFFKDITGGWHLTNLCVWKEMQAISFSFLPT